MIDDFKSCPFCKAPQKYPDGDDYWKIICGDKDEDTGWSAQYECPFCYAAGPVVSGYSDEESAIDAAIYAWNNQRAESQELPEWLKTELMNAVCCAKDDETKGWNDAIAYILSMKKPEEL